ncbi:MAG: hypothetical protein QM702_21575 [Rubrivivax sp.]
MRRLSAAWTRLALATGVVVAAGIACAPSHDDDAPPQPASEADPVPEPAPSPEGNVVTYPATTLGTTAMSVNGRIQPHGLPARYWFEHGPTTAYGSQTEPKALPGKLAAFYRESWDTSAGGWRGGSGDDLKFVPQGGLAGGYVHYQEPTGNDYNHEDGIGILHLTQYFYPGIFAQEQQPTAALGGQDPDMRDAKITIAVRGTGWNASGTELLWWSQNDLLHGASPADGNVRYSNWAHTGFMLTDRLFSGRWETVEYRLWNDTTDWTYAGTNQELNHELNRSVYVYCPLDQVLSHLDIDVFHVLTFVDPYHPPTGSIDFDELQIAYRNHSVVFPPNGGKLVSSTKGVEDPAALTDGWRNGPSHAWKAEPQVTLLQPQPMELVYELAHPVKIDRVQLHQHPEYPSKDVEVAVDDSGTWTTIASDVMAEGSPFGPNFAFLLKKDLGTVFDRATRRVRVRILSGYKKEFWGLGEIRGLRERRGRADRRRLVPRDGGRDGARRGHDRPRSSRRRDERRPDRARRRCPVRRAVGPEARRLDGTGDAHRRGRSQARGAFELARRRGAGLVRVGRRHRLRETHTPKPGGTRDHTPDDRGSDRRARTGKNRALSNGRVDRLRNDLWSRRNLRREVIPSP